LRDAEYVAIWVLEPGDSRATRKLHDAEIVLRQSWVAFEFDARLFQALHRSDDIRDLPAEDGVWLV